MQVKLRCQVVTRGKVYIYIIDVYVVRVDIYIYIDEKGVEFG